MTIKSDKCSVCGSETKQTKIIYTQTIGDKFYVVKDVPAEVCGQCSEEYLDPDTVDAIQKIIEQHKTPSKKIEVPVYNFPQRTTYKI